MFNVVVSFNTVGGKNGVGIYLINFFSKEIFLNYKCKNFSH